MNVLLWFKRDLRLADHPALDLACGLGRVLPVYVAEPDYWALPDHSARQWQFIAESLADLRAALAERGAPLVIRTGRAAEVLARLCRQHRITTLVSHEETGNLWTFQRDRAVAAMARDAGIDWQEVPQSGVFRGRAARAGNEGRNRWAARRDSFMADACLPAPGAIPAMEGVEPGPLPSSRALGLAEDPCPSRQPGGRAQGQVLLDGFLATRGRGYLGGLSSPLTAERACSRLSAHIAHGTLSPREVLQAAQARAAEAPGTEWASSLRAFASRLAWRDHFMQRLENAPEMEIRALHTAADCLRPAEADATRLARFAAGETGFPFVDAAMRYLAAGGWLNFRARAMLTSVATWHLWLEWRAVGHVLARRLTDYEPGIHWPQIQMQSGVTGIHIPRIYNPVKQGLDQDPQGRFTRRWLPELAAVPDAFLHNPWRWSGAGRVLGRYYPEPLVDPETAARAARDAITRLRRAEGFATESRAIAARHGQRRTSQAQDAVIETGSPRRRPAPDGQLHLDL
ncbi:FAD-binding domain-containing protein [Szabonella alba]|uniref:Deoxyribodipyrimidine photo-lyase n=1 Tax=Szabonella alba TaxID=2804194 RepID=A0A8K0VDS1_9RHOB|nr:FAD-binding domain-containing protein [Szabonella alba]MBL4917260.1 deoxyribodipyrimidine photo-lyase [Szabonella alba]